MTPISDRSTSREHLYQQAVEKFGFTDPYMTREGSSG
jgi:hypothetical protein